MVAPYRLTQQHHQAVTKGRGATAWKTGQGWLTTWTPEMVATAPDPYLAFADYVQQRLGVPWPTQKDQTILRAKINELFAHYPRADWFSLCRLVQWCKTRNKRDTRVWMVLNHFRAAWTAGALPEMDAHHTDSDLDQHITGALDHETDPHWRRRLLVAIGTTARQAAFNDWKTERSPLGIPRPQTGLQTSSVVP